jgi:hypothetical protein
MARNRWSASIGIDGRHSPDYAFLCRRASATPQHDDPQPCPPYDETQPNNRELSCAGISGSTLANLGHCRPELPEHEASGRRQLERVVRDANLPPPTRDPQPTDKTPAPLHSHPRLPDRARCAPTSNTGIRCLPTPRTGTGSTTSQGARRTLPAPAETVPAAVMGSHFRGALR